MMKIQITEKNFWDNKVEAYVFLLNENLESIAQKSTLEKLEKDFYPNLKDILKKHKFSGKKGESFVLSATQDKKLLQFIFVGVGQLKKLWNLELENLRRSVGAVVQLLKKYDINNAVLSVPEEKPFGLIKPRLIRQMIIAGYLAGYEFQTFKSNKQKEWDGALLLDAGKDEKETFALSLEEGRIIADATNFARYLADLPANHLSPTTLSQEAKKIADEFNIECEIFGKEKAAELGMGGFLAVDSGSDEDGKFVILKYSTEKKDAPTIALVGKGVTFDSGGISLKPAEHMTGMKFDMSGAAAVISTMKAIAQLKPEVNVVALTPLVENMPSGKACKQDDIITFMNGKTAEVLNTDAEGRLILADALCYAEKYFNPEIIIDVATLTGACLYALGRFYAGLMTRDDVLGTKLQAVSLVTGDKVWALPMDEDYKKAIESDVADIANCGSAKYKAGTITAAWFLSNFVEKAKWAHLDIAGVADNVPVNYIGNGKGSTGAGVRLLTEFVMNYKK